MSVLTPATNNTLLDLFIDPISYDLMQDPVIDPCGHTFERSQIRGWLAEHPSCPLSRRPLVPTDLIDNLVVREALEALRQAAPGIAPGEAKIADLCEADRQIVNLAMQALNGQRERDRGNNIPDRLPSPKSFLQKIQDYSQKLC